MALTLWAFNSIAGAQWQRFIKTTELVKRFNNFMSLCDYCFSIIYMESISQFWLAERTLFACWNTVQQMAKIYRHIIACILRDLVIHFFSFIEYLPVEHLDKILYKILGLKPYRGYYIFTAAWAYNSLIIHTLSLSIFKSHLHNLYCTKLLHYKSIHIAICWTIIRLFSSYLQIYYVNWLVIFQIDFE